MATKISFALMMGILLLICPSAVTAASDAVLVLHFDEGSGTVAHDSSGHGNDGAIYGATWVDGISGKALNFNGANNYVELPDLGSISDEFAIISWVKTSSSSMQTIFGGGEGDARYHPALGISFGSANKAGGCVNRYGAYVVSLSNINDGSWHQIAFVARNLNANTVNMKMYIDGSLSKEMNDPFPIRPWSGSHYIGKRANEFFFHGVIDEVAVYPRAISASEIQYQYNARRADPTPTPTPPTTMPTTATPTTTKTAISASLVKSINPQVVKQNQTVTITVTIENTGTTQLSDIEVIDMAPSEFIFLSGDTQSVYSSIKPGESRIIQYNLQSAGAGKFTLNAASARYADQSGNYSTINSNTPTIEVLTPLLDHPITTKAPGFDAILCIGGILAAILVLRKLK